jgi:NADH-quinone oxidoreductase subunit C
MTSPTMPDELVTFMSSCGIDSETVVEFGDVTLSVQPDRWVDTLTCLRDGLGFDYFDWLSAVDDPETFSLFCHVVSTTTKQHLLVRTLLNKSQPAADTITGVFRGAAWHERETFEMFGIEFLGHGNLRPLLLPDGFEGHPLRKDFVLAARVSKAWPGAKEPGESGDGSPRRRRMQPPGVPDPSWGPRDAGQPQAPDDDDG